MLNLSAAASTGIACTGMLYWMTKRKSAQEEKIEEMRKKMDRKVASRRSSAQITVSATYASFLFLQFPVTLFKN